MSTFWGIYCEDCKESSVCYLLYEEEVIELIQLLPCIREILLNSECWTLTTKSLNHKKIYDEEDFFDFLGKHHLHVLLMINEYNQKRKIC